MFVLVEKGCISVGGEIISKGEVVELDDEDANRLMKSPFLKLAELEPPEGVGEAAEESEEQTVKEKDAKKSSKKKQEEKPAGIPAPDIEGAVGK
jgi:hypothetical protein